MLLKARYILAGLLAATLALGPAQAQTPTQAPAQLDPEATLVEELVVSSSLGGPAFWKVTDGDTTISILGVPAGLPKGLRWDERRLVNRLNGADALILPPKIRSRPVVMTAYLIGNGKRFQTTPPVTAQLPPGLRARFEAARATLKVKPAETDRWKPGIAGIILTGEFRKPLKLDYDEPERRVAALARKARVKVVVSGAYDPMPAIKTLSQLDQAGHLACLNDALAEIEAGRGRITASADGWARGDTRAAVAVERGYDRCFAALPAFSALARRSMEDTTGAIARQMARPGKAVAVVDLRQLLARGGVLDQLKARGFHVETPGSE